MTFLTRRHFYYFEYCISSCFSSTINFRRKRILQAAIQFQSYLNSGVKIESINDLASPSVSRCQLSKHQGDSRGQYLVFIQLLRGVCKDNRSLSVRIWSGHCCTLLVSYHISHIPRGCHHVLHGCPPCPLSRIRLDLGSLSLRSLTQKLASAHTAPSHPVHLCFPPFAELTSPESQH